MAISGQLARSLVVLPLTTATKVMNWLEVKSESVNQMDSGMELLHFALVSYGTPAEIYMYIAQ